MLYLTRLTHNRRARYRTSKAYHPRSSFLRPLYCWHAAEALHPARFRARTNQHSGLRVMMINVANLDVWPL